MIPFVIYKDKLIRGRNTGLYAFPFIFISRLSSNIARTLIHELIHHAQFIEGWAFGHIIRYQRYQRRYGYRYNPCEVEARMGAKNPDYLKTRKPHAYRDYIEQAENYIKNLR